MTRPSDKHLDNDELDRLVSLEAEDVRDEGFLSDEVCGEARRHLESCQDCSRKVRMQRSVQSEMLLLGRVNMGQPGAECPRDINWLQLTAGLLPEAQTKEFMSHAAQCDYCGPMLRNAADVLSDDTTPNEDRALAALRSSRRGWQAEMAQQLRRTRQPAKRLKPWEASFVWTRAAFAATLALVTAIGWLTFHVFRTPSPEQLLAKAYTERRTLELRIPNAPYAPMRVERSADEPQVSRPPELLEAEALISRHLKSTPDDVHWLHAKGQADLLDNNFESARSTLDAARRLSPDDKSIQVDLASALFSLGDYGAAVNTLREVTSKDPKNAIAWFNLAIACERMHLLKEALAAWNNNLTLDPSSEWASEARRKKLAVEQQIQGFQHKSSQPLENSVAIAASFKSHFAHEAELLNQHLDSYFDVGVTNWLPQAARNRNRRNEANVERRAMEALAQVASDRHSDVWLRDVLASVDNRPGIGDALDLLAAAILANKEGDYSRAREMARDAEMKFSRARSLPGSLRSKFENVYAMQFLQQGTQCFEQAGSLLTQLKRRSYAWLEIQTQIQRANCANMTGQITASKQLARAALDSATKYHYDVLYLRATSLLAVLEWTSGDSHTAFKIANDGLEKFWSGTFPAMRAYNLYMALDSLAETSKQWFLQVSIGREATQLIEEDPDHSLRAIAYQELGKAALRSGELQIAAQSFQKSYDQFSKSPSGEAVRILKADTEIGMARTDYLRGDLPAAVDHLQGARPYIDKTSNRFLAMDFYLTEGDVLARTGNDEEAKADLLRAIGIAEKSLRTIDSERERSMWSKEYAHAYRSMVSLILRTDPVQAFDWWEWYKAAALRGVTADHAQFLHLSGTPQAESTAPRYQANPPFRSDGAAPSNTVLLSYAVLPGEVGGWVHDSKTTLYRRLPISPPELEALTFRFARHCSNPESDQRQLNREAKQLYAALIEPFAASLANHKKLLLEPDGVLDSIPFEALRGNDDQILAQYDISVSPGSAYLSSAQASLQVKPMPSILIAGNASGASGSKAQLLPSADQEATQLIPNSRLLLGNEATVERILTDIKQVDIFHFSGHAVARQGGSGLLLASRSQKNSWEVLDAILLEKTSLTRTKLVVLSACSTAGTRDNTLSEDSSLARTFLSLGVPQVVASRWPVDSDSTAILMENFYASLLGGDSVSEALRKARLDVSRNHGYSHPYYWAAFSVFGKT